MPSLLLDFEDKACQQRFPKHGWAKNSQGTKLLWIPIRTLVNTVRTIRESKGLTSEKAWSRGYNVAFAQMIKNLALASREMGSLMNRVNATPISPKKSTDSDVLHEAYDLIPIFCDMNLVYLRRLPERLLMAMRPVL